MCKYKKDGLWMNNVIEIKKETLAKVQPNDEIKKFLT